MIFDLDGIEVLLPYKRIRPEQYEYMLQLKKALDARGSGLFELPPRVGKTVATLSFISAYMFKYPQRVDKLVYCCKDLDDAEKVAQDLQNLFELYEDTAPSVLKSIIFAPHDSMCEFDDLGEYRNVFSVSRCKVVTEHHIVQSSVSNFFFNHNFYNIQLLRAYGLKHKFCPHYFAKHLLKKVDIIVTTYSCMLDINSSANMFNELNKNCCVVFENTGELEEFCLNITSYRMKAVDFESCYLFLETLKDIVQQSSIENRAFIRSEFKQYIKALNELILSEAKNKMSIYPFTTVPNEKMLENMFSSNHFLGFLNSLVTQIYSFMSKQLKPVSLLEFLKEITKHIQNGFALLGFSTFRLQKLLQHVNLDGLEINELFVLIYMIATVSINDDAFVVSARICETRGTTLDLDRALLISCIEPSLALAPVLKLFQMVIICSADLTPMAMFKRKFKFNPLISKRITYRSTSTMLLPLFVTKEVTYKTIRFKWSENGKYDVMVEKTGDMIAKMVPRLPGSMICFFASLNQMLLFLKQWKKSGILYKFSKCKQLVYAAGEPNEIEKTMKEHMKNSLNGCTSIVFMLTQDFRYYSHMARHNLQAVYFFNLPRDCSLNPKQLSANTNSKFNYKLSYLKQCIIDCVQNYNNYVAIFFIGKEFVSKELLLCMPLWIMRQIKRTYWDIDCFEAMRMVHNDFLQKLLENELEDNSATSLLARQDLNEFKLLLKEKEKTVDEVNGFATDFYDEMVEKIKAEGLPSVFEIFAAKQPASEFTNIKFQ